MKQSFPLMALRLKNWKSKGAAALPFIFAIVLIGGIVATAFISLTQPIIDEPLVVPAEPISLLFVGDIMMDRGIRSVVNKYHDGDYRALFTNTAYIADADIAFANLEGTATSEFGPRTGSKFSFRMAPQSLGALKDAGFDIVSFANNHVGDYSTKGFTETLTELEQVGLSFSGAGKTLSEASTPSIIDVRGTTIGYLAATDVGPDWLKATETKPGILLASDPNLATIISTAKAQVDILVLSYHWGNEYSPVSSRQEELAKASIDAGADIVVGHHPHVMQKFEYYNNGLILYSLGNFIFDQYFSEHTMRGMVATVSVDPETYALSVDTKVSPLNKQYIPQALVPFDESMLVTKSFTP